MSPPASSMSVYMTTETSLRAWTLLLIPLLGCQSAESFQQSKSDLIVAYKHGVSSEVPASSVMASPVVSCDEQELLSGAIQRMIFTDIHRLFVHRGDPAEISGVLSLSDAARARSGSCHACVSSRIRVEQAT